MLFAISKNSSGTDSLPRFSTISSTPNRLFSFSPFPISSVLNGLILLLFFVSNIINQNL
ncbi:hypothetical protein FM106_02010 [Brachybacterium faecium]|nr:hypothetical protein FM106_02010 [Brachybacterium faecium]